MKLSIDRHGVPKTQRTNTDRDQRPLTGVARALRNKPNPNHLHAIVSATTVQSGVKMGQLQCAACGENVDEFDTYFSDSGTVCPPCHSNQESEDRAEFQRGEHQSYDLMSSEIVTHHQETREENGRTVTVTRTSTVDFGVFTWLYKLFKMLMKKK